MSIMKSKHLTDEILQAFLLKEIQDDALHAHIAGCSICRTKLENYQHLITNLRKVESEAFSFDVTTVVMKKIEGYERQKNTKRVLAFWGVLGVLVLSVVLISIPFLKPILSVFFSMPLLTGIFIVGSGISVLIFLLSDSYNQYKIKEKIIFEKNLQPAG